MRAPAPTAGPAPRRAGRSRSRTRSRSGRPGGSSEPSSGRASELHHTIIHARLQLEVLADRGDARRGAQVVLAPAGRARHADAADERAARLDLQAAAHRGDTAAVADTARRTP